MSKAGKGKNGKGGSRDPTVAAIERLARQRERRRQSADVFKRERKAEEAANERAGKPGDVDFQRMIKKFRRDHADDDTTVGACGGRLPDLERRGCIATEAATQSTNARGTVGALWRCC